MSYMFYNCYSLILLDISNFNIQNVERINLMFKNVYSLISIDFSNYSYFENEIELETYSLGAQIYPKISMSNINSLINKFK